MISNFLPYPPRGGDRLRVASLLDWLVRSGHEVSFLLIATGRFHASEIKELRKRSREIEVLDLRTSAVRIRHTWGGWGRRFLSQFERGRRYLRSRALLQKSRSVPTLKPIDLLWSDAALKKFSQAIRRMPRKPEAVICEYLTLTRAFESSELSGSLKILDTLEVMHERMAMLEKGLDPWIACSAEEEARSLKRADVILALQEEDAKVFRRLVPDREVIAVGQPFSVFSAPFPKVSGSTKPGTFGNGTGSSCLLVGTSHDVNLEGLRWFQKEVWPRILQEVSSAKLLIAGSLGEHALPQESIEILGEVDDLDRVYESASVVVVPVFSGGPLKMKFLEALSRGKAVVATRHAGRGIAKKEVFLREDDPILFAAHVVSLLKNPKLRRDFENKALAFARSDLGREKVYSSLDTLLRRSPWRRSLLDPR